jgi:leucyl aminopeptidase
MYNFNDHTLCRELSKNIPQLEIKSISKLERSNVISFIGTFEEYTSYLPQINNLLGINNDVIKNLFTDNSKITAKRVNINDQDLITINYSNNKIDNDLTEQALSKICELLVSKLRNDDSASITFLLTPNFCEKLPNLSTFFNALFAALPFNDNRFKSDESPIEFKLNKITISPLNMDYFDDATQKKYNDQCIKSSIYLQNVLYARLMANLPGNICTPNYVSLEAQAIADEFKTIDTLIYGLQDLANMNMNAYLAVAKGSKQEPFMSVLSYNGDTEHKTAPIVLVGKGLTFDSGGISLKPGAGMDEMMFDKCGAISVLATIRAVAMLKLKINIIAIAACAENLPDGNSYKPGDIIQARNGTTIEVLNTDAEGRMVLCDALSYATTFKPRYIIDIATLTGACMVALGSFNTGIFSNSKKLMQDFINASLTSNDSAWPMPMGELYDDMIEARFGDIANTGGRLAGATTAAQFLQNFVENTPWVHLDIAGTAWVSGKKKTATGRPVSLLLDFLQTKAC